MTILCVFLMFIGGVPAWLFGVAMICDTILLATGVWQL